MALAGGFTFRMEDQRSYESHGDGLQSEDGLIHTFDVQASSSGLGMVLLDTLTGSGLHPASRAFLRPGAEVCHRRELHPVSPTTPRCTDGGGNHGLHDLLEIGAPFRCCTRDA